MPRFTRSMALSSEVVCRYFGTDERTDGKLSHLCFNATWISNLSQTVHNF